MKKVVFLLVLIALVPIGNIYSVAVWGPAPSDCIIQGTVRFNTMLTSNAVVRVYLQETRSSTPTLYRSVNTNHLGKYSITIPANKRFIVIAEQSGCVNNGVYPNNPLAPGENKTINMLIDPSQLANRIDSYQGDAGLLHFIVDQVLK